MEFEIAIQVLMSLLNIPIIIYGYSFTLMEMLFYFFIAVVLIMIIGGILS